MQQKEKIGKPTPDAKAEQHSKGPVEVIPGEKVDVIRPRCMSLYCTARREKGEKRADGSLIGDPLEMTRLRYDFEDGVVAETLFCADCRQIINATMYGLDRMVIERNKRAANEAAAKVPDPPTPALAAKS